MDERIKTLAHNLVNYSCGVKEGDKVYVHYIGNDKYIWQRAFLLCTTPSPGYSGK